MNIRKPKEEEIQVMDWLKSQGYKDVVYEPDGNNPPDVLLDKQIAIEVRRLNQNTWSGDRIEGLEQIQNKVHSAVISVLNEHNPYNVKNSAIVSYLFNRPFKDVKALKKWLVKILKEHDFVIDQKIKYEYDYGFEISFWPLDSKWKDAYVYGASSDLDSGGYGLEVFYRNLKWVIEEKDNKIEKYRPRYNEWWIALVDHIGIRFTEDEWKQFYNLPRIETTFNRILIISPGESISGKFLYE